MKRKQLRIIDLFAGVGGFRIAFDNANNTIGKDFFKVVWGNQWEPGKKVQYAADIYRKHFGNKEFINEDIATVETSRIPKHDMVVGGFPCQDYSVATTKKLSNGIEGKKGVLWWQIERILKEQSQEERPEFVLFENVDRLLSSPAKQRGRDFAIILTCLDLLGYMVEWRVIDASEYGYPQRRKRTYFLGYKKGSKIYDSFNGEYQKWLLNDGIFAKAFKIVQKKGTKAFEDMLYRPKKALSEAQEIKNISDNFNLGGKLTPFKKSGVLYKGKFMTMDVEPIYEGKLETLGDIIKKADEKDFTDYIIPKEEYTKWNELKGAKKLSRVDKLTGFEYSYSEGAITYPDILSRPSRTIITGEGGKSPSRFKHVIKMPSGELRRLTPIELELLDMFPAEWTEGVSPTTRAFLMGNALVVGVIQQIAETLYKSL